MSKHVNSFDYKQLCAAVDLLRRSNINLNYHDIALQILESNQLDDDKRDALIKNLHNKYRKICEEMGLIKKNQCFWVH